MSDLKEIQVKDLNVLFNEMKGLIDRKDAEIKSYGAELAETKSHIEKLNNAIDELDVKLQRPAVETKEDKSAVETESTKAFNSYLRKGFNGMSDMERKAMISSDNTTGGFLTSSEKERMIIKDITEISPVRQVVRVRTGSKGELEMPVRTGSVVGGYWVNEAGSRSDLVGSTYGKLKIPAHELTGYVDISSINLDDSDYNLEQEVIADLVEQFAKTEGTAFVSGNGVNKPQGLLSATIGEVNSGNATLITADGLISLFYTPKPAYANAGAFMLNRNTLKAIRQLKDGAGNYLWTPAAGLRDSARPSLILGQPYYEAVDMPDIAAGTFPVIFGDFAKAYTIYDRKGFSILRDDYTQMGNGIVRFYGVRRVGGQVVQTEAIKKLKISV
jgi:HK97 family phage major capsid protein